LPAALFVEVKTAAAPQVASPGPNNAKVIVPVGVKPLASVAISKMLPPTGVAPEAWVAIVGVAFVTSRYFASLGIPLAKTVTIAEPSGKPLTGIEVKAELDHPAAGSTGRKVVLVVSILRNCTTG
jgi:hypothetical protein